MKKTLLIIYLHLFFLTGYGQSHRWFAGSLIDECDCPDRILSIDSVYSFLHDNPIKGLLYGGSLFVVVNKPLSQNLLRNHLIDYELLKRVIKYRFEEVEEKHGLSNVQITDSLIDGLGYDNARLIPPKPLAELFVAALDTTIRYTHPVEEWDVSRLGKEWIPDNTWDYVKTSLDKNIEKYLTDINSSYEDPRFAEGLALATTILYKNTSFVFMSMPVFDKEYNHALMMFKFRGTWGNYSLGFFKRTDKGWIFLFGLYRGIRVTTSLPDLTL